MYGNRRTLKTDGLQAERENGKRRASIRDFHSFRAPRTWKRDKARLLALLEQV